MLPNFLIVGAAKSGTTSLHYYLKDHPQVFLPAEKKELRFFSQLSSTKNGCDDPTGSPEFTTCIDDYIKHFECVSNEIAIGECSPDYLYFYQRSIPKIKYYLEDPKIINVLRNPIERAYSHYLMNVRDGREHLPIKEALERELTRKKDNWMWGWQYRNVGLYSRQVKAYIDNFSNVKVYLFDDLLNNSANLVKSIYKFLEVDESYVPSNIKERFNTSGVPQRRWLHDLFTKPNKIKSLFKPVFDDILPKRVKRTVIAQVKNRNIVKTEIDFNIRENLNRYYFEDIQKLQKMINRDLSNWIT